jgi:transcriptional regulator with XRE-family HTH domain
MGLHGEPKWCMLGLVAPTTYSQVLTANLRVARSRLGIEQESVAARMRALGYTSWKRQTVSKVERGDRRLLAEEIPALAIVLCTAVAALLEPAANVEDVKLPSGASINAGTVYRSVHGFYEIAVTWDGDEPVFSEVYTGQPEVRQSPWPPTVGMPTRAGQRIAELEAQLARLQQERG